MAILDWLRGKGNGPDDPESAAIRESEVATVRKIAHELDAIDKIDSGTARYIACFAYILGRVAHADLDISEEETMAMEHLVAERAGLPETHAVLVVQMAKTHNQLFGGTENYLVTREFDEIATRDDKLALLDCLYAISAADESISAIEDAEIRKIASELKLSHRDFITTRMGYTEHLSVLKD